MMQKYMKVYNENEVKSVFSFIEFVITLWTIFGKTLTFKNYGHNFQYRQIPIKDKLN